MYEYVQGRIQDFPGIANLLGQFFPKMKIGPKKEGGTRPLFMFLQVSVILFTGRGST